MAKRNPVHTSDLAKMRADAETRYQNSLKAIERLKVPFAKAEQLAKGWTKGRKGREARVWAFDGCVSLYFGLAKDEIFASAEDAFDAAQIALRACFPADWSGEWSEVKDESRQDEAQRGSTLDVGPMLYGHRSFTDGLRIYLHVYAKVGDGAACNVVQIGERLERDYVSYTDMPMKMKPVYRAVCPGDPVPAEALRLAASINPKQEA